MSMTIVLGRGQIANDPERQGKHRAACALQNPPQDYERQRAGDCRQHAAQDQECERGDQQPLLPELIAELTEYRRQQGTGEQIGGQNPADAQLVGVQRGPQGVQGRVDHRLDQRI
jgi:hypothetical protein